MSTEEISQDEKLETQEGSHVLFCTIRGEQRQREAKK